MVSVFLTLLCYIMNMSCILYNKTKYYLHFSFNYLSVLLYIGLYIKANYGS